MQPTKVKEITEMLYKAYAWLYNITYTSSIQRYCSEICTLYADIGIYNILTKIITKKTSPSDSRADTIIVKSKRGKKIPPGSLKLCPQQNISIAFSGQRLYSHNVCLHVKHHFHSVNRSRVPPVNNFSFFSTVITLWNITIIFDQLRIWPNGSNVYFYNI